MICYHWSTPYSYLYIDLLNYPVMYFLIFCGFQMLHVLYRSDRTSLGPKDSFGPGDKIWTTL